MKDPIGMITGTIAFIGPSEIIIVLIVALLVFGPERLPQIGREIGKFKRQMDHMKDDLHRTIEGLDEYIPTDTPRYDAPYGQTYPQNDGHPLYPQTMSPDRPLMSEPPGPLRVQAALESMTVAEDLPAGAAVLASSNVTESTLPMHMNGVQSAQETTGVVPAVPTTGTPQMAQSTKEHSL